MIPNKKINLRNNIKHKYCLPTESRIINESINEYELAYGDEYTKIKNQLQNLIINGETGENNFCVFNLESGAKKTRITNDTLHEYFKDGLTKKNKYLYIVPFSRDDAIKETVQAISSNEFIALGIDKDNWSSYWKYRQDELNNYPVLVMTHSRYINVCLNPSLRKAFAEGRNTLIIDEKISFPTIGFDGAYYKDVQHALKSWELDRDLEEVCKPLMDMILEISLTRESYIKCIPCRPTIDDNKLVSFISKVRSNGNFVHDRGKIKQFIENLEQIYSNDCLYNFKRISTVNPEHKLWGMKNNIILDANAASEPLYKVSDNIEVLNNSNFVDHCQSSIQLIHVNTSRYKIKQSVDYFQKISLLIKDKLMTGQKVLLVTQMSFREKLKESLQKCGITDVAYGKYYQNQQVCIEHFGNLIGSNKYREFKQCWILGTPHLRKEVYIHHWKHYTGKSFVEADLELSFGGFKNPLYEQIRKGSLIGMMYQTIKRVQRNPFPKAQLYIATMDEAIFKGVANQMLNIQVREPIELEVKYINQKPRLDEKFRDNVLLLPPKSYKKKELCEVIGTTTKNFMRMVDNSKIIQDMISAGIISFPKENNKIMIRH